VRFKIILEEDEEVGGFIASYPGLPGCFSQGDTAEEAIENIKDAIQACLESLAEDELQEYIGKSSCRVVEVVAQMSGLPIISIHFKLFFLHAFCLNLP
jgi:predicted RNase H-like HicB family nuclease